MTKEQYEQKLKQLDIQLERDKIAVVKEYCNANNKVAIGDIVEDHYQKVKVEKIGYHVSLNDPQCVYTGKLLKKDNTPTKKGEISNVYQNNIKNITPCNS